MFALRLTEFENPLSYLETENLLHDLEQVRAHFPETLLMARSGIAWGQTARVLTPDNLRRARQMAEAWDESAPPCAVDP